MTTTTTTAVAREVLETIPMVMRTIRCQVRSQRQSDLSVPQFRTLGYLHRHPGCTLSDVSEHVGLTLPAMSRLVDGLVHRELLTRNVSVDDRRRVELSLTKSGAAILEESRDMAQARLAEILEPLSPGEMEQVLTAMQHLRSAFTAPAPAVAKA